MAGRPRLTVSRLRRRRHLWLGPASAATGWPRRHPQGEVDAQGSAVISTFLLTNQRRWVSEEMVDRTDRQRHSEFVHGVGGTMRRRRLPRAHHLRLRDHGIAPGRPPSPSLHPRRRAPDPGAIMLRRGHGRRRRRRHEEGTQVMAGIDARTRVHRCVGLCILPKLSKGRAPQRVQPVSTEFRSTHKRSVCLDRVWVVSPEG